jgi:hypothetical protein
MEPFLWQTIKLKGKQMAKKKNEIVGGVTDFSVSLADNGFIVEYSGQDEDDNWSSSKKLILSVDELIAEVKDILTRR